jgi:hypothetical protein
MQTGEYCCLGESRMIWRKILPPSSGSKHKTSRPLVSADDLLTSIRRRGWRWRLYALSKRRVLSNEHLATIQHKVTSMCTAVETPIPMQCTTFLHNFHLQHHSWKKPNNFLHFQFCSCFYRRIIVTHSIVCLWNACSARSYSIPQVSLP